MATDHNGDVTRRLVFAEIKLLWKPCCSTKSTSTDGHNMICCLVAAVYGGVGEQESKNKVAVVLLSLRNFQRLGDLKHQPTEEPGTKAAGWKHESGKGWI